MTPANESRVDTRICFFGDSLTAGAGDDECLGYCGRLGAMACRRGVNLTVYNLGVRHETSVEIAARWRAEAIRRMPDQTQNHLVFCFGVNDVIVEDGARRVSLDRSLATARTMISEAAAWLPTRWISPPAVADSPVQEPLVELHHGYVQLARELSVPYLSLLAPLGADARYMNDLRAHDGYHPSSIGYALWAERIAAWTDWYF